MRMLYKEKEVDDIWWLLPYSLMELCAKSVESKDGFKTVFVRYKKRLLTFGSTEQGISSKFV